MGRNLSFLKDIKGSNPGINNLWERAPSAPRDGLGSLGCSPVDRSTGRARAYGPPGSSPDLASTGGKVRMILTFKR
ncbi:hypothetical protein TIFTF001_019690 [Ficus carica]|uniref:Uncharacterized protein n=1 Tax=Ficus carica TaxID=3494 RepID=A0AA88DCY8_FICCA|nr:hypothetical protein TIFTF001_019690 [Ficus carica]